MPTTVIDYSAGVPAAAAVKAAGHAGAVRYVSPPRRGAAWMRGKPIHRAEVDDFENAGLDLAFVWQHGKTRDPDVMRGAAGGRADALAAQQQLRKIGRDGWPVFFAVDFNITLAQWNATAAHYFRAACDVLGRNRVGIYGHSRVCDWAREDAVIADLGGGKHLMWQTAAWSTGVIHPAAVLHQRVIDTRSRPGPKVGGITVDVSDVRHHYWGQRPPSTPPASAGPPKENTMKSTPAHRGDPLFLPELLRAWGVTVVEMDGWRDRGQGDFTDIWGVICHHTGAATTPPSIIAHGHSALRGLLSQIHLAPDGTATICGAGIAYHAGKGSLPGLGGGYVKRRSRGKRTGFTVGNARTIGIEAQHSGNPGDPWPEAQLDAYARIAAAILWYLGHGTDRVWGHKEYAKPAGRKVDPSFDMEGFRRRVQVLLDNPPVQHPPAPAPAPAPAPGPAPRPTPAPAPPPPRRAVDALVLDQLAGPRDPDGVQRWRGWPQLGGRTVVDALAALGARMGAPGFTDPAAGGAADESRGS